jgi:Lrp/AsnC family transcriptional regulator, leucine-responsive regulatory protein
MIVIVLGDGACRHGNMKVDGLDRLRNDSGSGAMPTVPESDMLDEINRRLLTELHADPRIAMSALARSVGMSAPAVTERVQRLERAGVITGYRMDVDPAALGLPVAAFVRIRPTAGQLSRIAALAASLPQVTECHRITGEDCFLVKVHAATIPDLETTLDQFLLYGQTVSSIIVTSPVPSRPLPVTVWPVA